MYITISDITQRLLYRKPHWLQGIPDVRVDGSKGGFGELVFDFHDEVVSYRLYLHVDPKVVLRLALLTIIVFPDMARRLHDQERESWAALRSR
jgi:hypothetical protein